MATLKLNMYSILCFSWHVCACVVALLLPRGTARCGRSWSGSLVPSGLWFVLMSILSSKGKKQKKRTHEKPCVFHMVSNGPNRLVQVDLKQCQTLNSMVTWSTPRWSLTCPTSWGLFWSPRIWREPGTQEQQNCWSLEAGTVTGRFTMCDAHFFKLSFVGMPCVKISFFDIFCLIHTRLGSVCNFR